MHSPPAIISPDKILQRARPTNKAAAITAVGRPLVHGGHVMSEYIPAIFVREDISTTYPGNEVAIPHGTRDALTFVRSSGITILHVPDGVDFGGGNVVRFVIGLAARSDDHLDILTSIAEICNDDERLAGLFAADSPDEVIALLQHGLSA